NDNLTLAMQGDAEAQYKVGNAYCCSPKEETGRFYNTKLSVDWLCASAHQGHSPAMYKLGKIFSGDVVDGVRLLRRAAMSIAGSTTNPAIAYTWLRQAADQGVEEARVEADTVWSDLSQLERLNATESWKKGLNAPCLWDDVMGNH
ncbi:MAG: sel1 repeat family protein, partial [Rhodospirillales bacterium]|nr:sel1 repeat family protein [Rhodospirillales bacterium]